MLDILTLVFQLGALAGFLEDADIFLCHSGSGENGEAERFWNAQKPQQQMVGADVTRLHILCFLLSQLQCQLGVWSEAVEWVHKTVVEKIGELAI